MSFQINRNDHLIGGLDLGRQGIEFPSALGPVLTKDAAAVTYVDFLGRSIVGDDPDLHARLPWREQPLKESGPFAYAIASHVIQHIPNLIDWFDDVSQSLTGDGIISLAIPDKRYGFDLKRPLSTTGTLVEAHLQGNRRPSIAQMFDSCRMTVAMNTEDAWAGVQNAPLFVGDVALQLAYEQAVRQYNGNDYIDSHCWIFTPSSFLDIFEDLINLKLLSLEFDRFVPTIAGTSEFLVRFRRAGQNPLETVRAARDIVWKQERSNLLR
ncbi:class I SAM-dependent methyltransferase [Sphingobium sp. Z007]|uniref:class I SAM-dependent methyltransferase n=1 Tax=Sphingobium sp. Z007 TaxID=627495 RepID=UPI001125104E|nr:class I SAM-dependent methyltransferase [Sphingobium sp. Z007]